MVIDLAKVTERKGRSTGGRYRDPTHRSGTAGGGGSIWPGIVAAIVLLVVFAAAIWTYIRNRPVDTDRTQSQSELPKAA